MKILSHVLEVLTGFVAATLFVGCHTEARQSQDADKASDVEKTETVPQQGNAETHTDSVEQIKSGDVQKDISNEDKDQAKGQENIDDLNKEKENSPEDYHGILDRDNEIKAVLYGPTTLTDDEIRELFEDYNADPGEGK